jgi:predicted ATPase
MCLKRCVSTEHSYRFLHDRVQEAAYSLIPEKVRAETHLRIGRLLAAYILPEKRKGAIFEIVNQLNRASHLITSAEERKRLAELNLMAGRRAKSSTAYASALSHLGAARALLTEENWDEEYELIFSIEYDTAECELLTADMVAAENRLLKVTLAGMINYFSILQVTILVFTQFYTPLIIALGSTGATMHKGALRVAGCLIGGALGMICTIWVIPTFETLGCIS